MSSLFFGETEGPTPGDMGIEAESSKSPEATGRPTAEEIDDHVANLEFQKKRVPHQFEQSIFEIEEIAAGRGDQEIREEFYKGWTNEDFQAVLSKVRGKEV